MSPACACVRASSAAGAPSDPPLGRVSQPRLTAELLTEVFGACLSLGSEHMPECVNSEFHRPTRPFIQSWAPS